MGAPAHISAHGKHGAARPVGSKQLDFMVGNHVAHITVLHIREAKNQRNLVRLFTVVPQLICHYKRHLAPVLIDQIGNILRHDTKYDAIFAQHMLCHVKNLLHRPVIIKQVRSPAPGNMPDSEELLHMVHIRLVLLTLTPHTVLQPHGNRIPVHLRNVPAFPLLHHRL